MSRIGVCDDVSGILFVVRNGDIMAISTRRKEGGKFGLEKVLERGML